jgi:CheY-like chemotaxis protein
MIDFSELSKTDKQINNIGKEYIKKSTEITNIIDYALTTFTNSYFVIHNTLNLLKNETEYLFTNNLEDNKDLKIFIKKLYEEIVNLFSVTKAVKVKLSSISESKFPYKNKIMINHVNQYNRLHSAVSTLVNELMDSTVKPLFDMKDKIEDISYVKYTPKSKINEYYQKIEDRLKEGMDIIRNVMKNNKLINNHITKYRDTIRKENKINDILKEIYKIKPVALMRPGQRIWAKDIKKGDIFITPLYTADSKLFKDSFVPFTEKDIDILNKQRIITLYQHNNITKSLKPWDYDILVVDDDEMITDLVGDELRRLQFNVRVFNEPDNALKSIYQKLPSIILLDIEMPGMNGIEFLKQLYSEKYGLLKENIPVIMVTSQKKLGWVRSSIGKGARDYLTKPFTTDDLLTKITSYLH